MFLLLVAAVALACNLPGQIATPLFFEDFEDNDLSAPPPGWQDIGGAYTIKAIQQNTLLPSRSLVLEGGGPYADVPGGFYYDFTTDSEKGIGPTVISFVVRACETGDEFGRSANFLLFGSGTSFDQVEALQFAIQHNRETGFHGFEDSLVLPHGATLGNFPSCSVWNIEIVFNWLEKPLIYHLNVSVLKQDGTSESFEIECGQLTNEFNGFTSLYLYNQDPGQSAFDNIIMKYDPGVEFEPCPGPPTPDDSILEEEISETPKGFVPSATATASATHTWTPTATAVNPTVTNTATHTQTIVPSETPTPTPVPPSSLSGIIWKDDNGDGVQNGQEQVLSGSTMELRPGSCSEPTSATAVTQSDGSYTFENLSSGNYCVVLDINTLPGASWRGTQPYSAPNQSPEQDVLIQPGEQKGNINFGVQEIIG